MVMLPLGDIIDRISILQLHVQHLNNEEVRRHLQAYWATLSRDTRISLASKKHYLSVLQQHNAQMWGMESIIRDPKGRSLCEIGRIALALRDLNRKRNRIRRQIDAEAAATSSQEEVHGAIAAGGSALSGPVDLPLSFSFTED
jgi:hypothetical protein